MDSDLTAAGVDREIHRMRKEGAFLNMVVGDQAKVAALGENGGFVVDGTIFEGKNRPRSDLVAADNLQTISRGQHAPIFGTHIEKAMNGSLYMTNRYGFGWRARLHGANQEGDQ